MTTEIYLAGPLFSIAEKNFNLALRDNLKRLIADILVTLPQECAPALLKQENGFRMVFDDCLRRIDECDIVIASLEGSDADSGTCVEVGYAYARGKPIIGFRTDPRASEDEGLNLMLSNICGADGKHLLTYTPAESEALDIERLAADLARQVKAVLKELADVSA